MILGQEMCEQPGRIQPISEGDVSRLKGRLSFKYNLNQQMRNT
jgi:hypothetical protein